MWICEFRGPPQGGKQQINHAVTNKHVKIIPSGKWATSQIKAMLLPGAEQEEIWSRQDQEMSIQILISQILKPPIDRAMEFLWESREARWDPEKTH